MRGNQAPTNRHEYGLDETTAGYTDRILDFGLDCDQVWGKLMSPKPQHPIDVQIADVVLTHDLTVATRHTANSVASGVKHLNPLAG